VGQVCFGCLRRKPAVEVRTGARRRLRLPPMVDFPPAVSVFWSRWLRFQFHSTTMDSFVELALPASVSSSTRMPIVRTRPLSPTHAASAVRTAPYGLTKTAGSRRHRLRFSDRLALLPWPMRSTRRCPGPTILEALSNTRPGNFLYLRGCRQNPTICAVLTLDVIRLILSRSSTSGTRQSTASFVARRHWRSEALLLVGAKVEAVPPGIDEVGISGRDLVRLISAAAGGFGVKPVRNWRMAPLPERIHARGVRRAPSEPPGVAPRIGPR